MLSSMTLTYFFFESFNSDFVISLDYFFFIAIRLSIIQREISNHRFTDTRHGSSQSTQHVKGTRANKSCRFRYINTHAHHSLITTHTFRIFILLLLLFSILYCFLLFLSDNNAAPVYSISAATKKGCSGECTTSI